MENKNVQEIAEATPTSKKKKVVRRKAPEREYANEGSLPDKEEVKEPIKEKTEKEKLDDYLALPEVCNNLRIWGKLFQERFRNNWFTIEQIIKKTPLKEVAKAQAILDFLILKGWAHRTPHQGLMKYKVTFEPTEKVHQLRLEIERLELQKESLLKEIAKLEGTSVNVG